MYSRFRDTATKLLAKYGLSRTLTKPAGPTHSPVTGAIITPAPVPTTSSVKAVFVGINNQWTDKFAIQSGDAVALVAADGAEPKQNDDLDGWAIIAIEPVTPADVTILYRCHLRKQ